MYNNSFDYKEEFSCPKFKISSYKRYDDNVDDILKIYLIDDDEYVLAIVHDISDDKFYMIQQERYGIDDYLIEFVGGGKEHDELPFDAIAREIEEEIGIKAGIDYNKDDIKLISETFMNPSESKSKAYLFYVEVSKKLDEDDNNDKFENLNIMKLTLDEVKKIFEKGLSSTASELLWNKYLAIKDKIEEYNVIFCDIDGVLIRNDELNPEKVDEYHFDEKMICNLINVAKCTNSKIVIDSTWRKNDDELPTEYFGKEYPNPLPAIRYRLGNLYLDTTTKNENVSKIDSVRLWLEETNFNRKYVIIDDDKDENFQNSEFKNVFIMTDPIKGLLEKDCNRIIDIICNKKTERNDMNNETLDESVLFDGNNLLTVDEFVKILSLNVDKCIYADTGEEVNLFSITPYKEQDGTVILQSDLLNDEDLTCEEIMERLLLDVRRGSISRSNAMKFAYGDLFDDKDAYIADLEEIYENDGALFVKFKLNENANSQLENENEPVNEQLIFDLQKAFDRYNNASEDLRFEVDDIVDKFTEDANKILDKNDPELHGSFLQYADGFEIQDAYVNANKNILKFIDQQYPWMKEPFENAPVESKIEKLYVLLDDLTLPAIVISYCPLFNKI